MVKFINCFNIGMFILFMLLYSYQFFYIFVSFFKKKQKLPQNPSQHKYCILIAARNEENVIGNLIDSIQQQHYPSSLIQICVVADNCTDRTAAVARKKGAFVSERNNLKLIGKGYALDYLIKHIPPSFNPDAYLVFDADNLLDPNYILEINKVYAAGYKVSTSYRNSCNYNSNWISAGYALWFLRESKFLNQSRMSLGTSCAISGTGFMVDASIIKKNNGWIHHLLTEDIEFSTDSALRGIKIGYCEKAILYDEQPTTFRKSWIQRERWAKGFYQVFGKYGKKLIKSALYTKNFAAYDMLMTIAPALLISISTIIINLFMFMYFIISDQPFFVYSCIQSAFEGILNYYTALFFIGALTTITEWTNIRATTGEKIRYCFSFPIFMFTYVPIAIVALRKNVTWDPISHGCYSINGHFHS